ncbi:hypothetical protein KU6B_08000 [Mameliella alba]|uniref:hypothetical protein n=1 Tax=Mameliella alba TaxID=561184 RepID=UPI0013E41BFA|nr:hypothetical protein [Mameliella alba]BBU54535.1 hypothetical protein KU6B_08000 [Mameliella alba]
MPDGDNVSVGNWRSRQGMPLHWDEALGAVENSSDRDTLERHLAAMAEIASAEPRREIEPELIEHWAGNLRNHQFYNSVALMITEKYAAGLLSYRTCDCIMSDLWRAWLSGFESGTMVPDPFYEIFEAFDAGEYHRSPEKTDDSVKDHTDHRITEILSRPSYSMT